MSINHITVIAIAHAFTTIAATHGAIAATQTSEEDDPHAFVHAVYLALWDREFVLGESFLELGPEVEDGMFEVIVWGNDPPEVLDWGLYLQSSHGDDEFPNELLMGSRFI